VSLPFNRGAMKQALNSQMWVHILLCGDPDSDVFPPWLITSSHEQPAICLLGLGARRRGGGGGTVMSS